MRRKSKPFVLALLVGTGLASAARSQLGLESTKIAFSSVRDGNSEMYVMDSDGTDQTRLTNNPANDSKPSWSPDGAKIAFNSDRGGDFEIYVMNADGTNPVNLTRNGATDFDPSWSPDGTRIAFRSDRDGNFEIYVMNADGANPVRLTNRPGFDNDPDWSPVDSKIAFTSQVAGNEDIYVIEADGTGLTRLTNEPLADRQPSWSPDGTQIAFASKRAGSFGIYVMDANGQNPTEINPGPFSDDPTWSPDGSMIAFVSRPDGVDDEVLAMNSDGSNPVNLTNRAGNDAQPSWSPFLVKEVGIDVKPGSDPNCFNLNGHGVIPVAFLGSADFDAVDVDAESVVFDGLAVRVRGNRRPLCSFEDVNGDSFLDLVCQFEDEPANWTGGSATATLRGVLFDGTPIEGTDFICIVP